MPVWIFASINIFLCLFMEIYSLIKLQYAKMVYKDILGFDVGMYSGLSEFQMQQLRQIHFGGCWTQRRTSFN